MPRYTLNVPEEALPLAVKVLEEHVRGHRVLPCDILTQDHVFYLRKVKGGITLNHYEPLPHGY